MNFTQLCKIAVLSNSIEDRDFEYKGKQWKAGLKIEKNDVLTILDFCKTYKRTGFQVIECGNNELFLVHKIQIIRNQEQFYAQRTLFPLIIKNYSPDNDLSVIVGTKEFDQQQPLKVIKKFVTVKLYKALFNAHENETSLSTETNETAANEKLKLPFNFLPKLCRYQESTVKWLLKKEKKPGKLRCLFRELQAKDDATKVYKNILCTQFQNEIPMDIELAPGGILAEEMGLGKTVEMLALILLNKRTEIIDFVQQNKIIDEDSIPLKKRRWEEMIFCICSTEMRKKNLIKCPLCRISQHERCVTKHNKHHESSINEPYLCPNCWKTSTESNLLESGATLIVTPHTIKKQWMTEIQRHIAPRLRVHLYEGISNGDWITPRQLSDYDIVLTDYSILKREVFHTAAHDSDRVMRHKPRSMRVYTPLLMINWWRVCLDEAQMVESDTSQMAALVRIIPAINRWAVTGTPIQRSVDDLYPLVRFIGLEYSLNNAAWETLVKDFMLHCDDKNSDDNPPTLLLIEILQNFMWRTCKEQVLDELLIPPQTEIIHRLTFSDLERLFYTEQHEECEFKFNETLNKCIVNTDSLCSTSHQIMTIIMKPLLKIRQCCTIPTLVSSIYRQTTTGVVNKQFLQPKELHAHLKLTNENECKSELRSMASSYNGCAAIYFIKRNYKEAVNSYESVLKLARQYATEKNITVDSLLQIHALYNILEARNISSELALQISNESLEQYENQLNNLEWKYLEMYASQLLQVQTSFYTTRTTLLKSFEELSDDPLDFLSRLLSVDDIDIQCSLLAKILDECIRKFGSMRLEAASSLRGVLFMIVSWHDKLMKEYKKIDEALEELSFYTKNVKPRSQVSVEVWRRMSNFITTVYDCHLMELRNLKNNSDDEAENPVRTISRKRKRQKQNLCKLCQLRNLINGYECLLFKKSIDERTNVVEGDENPQLEIEMIRIIFAFLKPKYPEFAAEIDQHMLAFGNMQSYCKKAIKYWIEIEFTVKAYDELDMCKMRITLTEDEEEKSNYMITNYELDEVYAEQQNNLFEAQRMFAMKLARLKYIKHLEDNSDTGPCPICQSEEEIRHIVLECGHQLCLACFKNLRQYYSSQKITCSICRHEQSTQKVYYVTCAPNKNTENEDITIKGDFSSKICFIVQLVLKLQKEHSLENAASSTDSPLKILIFSQWQSVLLAIAEAFKENSVRYIIHSTVRTIENFKDPDLGITCFLMPLSKGCKGLNLIEATHVFLVEPILNPSEEQQAIGRVHRFGQTKPTSVHRFIVDGTIEENIYEVVAAGKESQQNWEFDNLTFESLRDLFKLRNNLADINDSIVESA